MVGNVSRTAPRCAARCVASVVLPAPGNPQVRISRVSFTGVSRAVPRPQRRRIVPRPAVSGNASFCRGVPCSRSTHGRIEPTDTPRSATTRNARSRARRVAPRMSGLASHLGSVACDPAEVRRNGIRTKCSDRSAGGSGMSPVEEVYDLPAPLPSGVRHHSPFSAQVRET
jgi:hypothetical protein